jgi:hypothetical protein
MSTATTVVERYQPVLSEVERATLLGFLAGYRGFTRDAYTLDLRQFTAWCWQHDRRLFDVRRVDIECFARDFEERGKARATVLDGCARSSGSTATPSRRGVIEHSPGVHIRRRPRIDCESHVAHLDRDELGAILVAAGLSSPRSRLGVAAGVKRAAGVRSDRRQYRSSRPRTGGHHPHRGAEGRQGRHHAARPTGRPGD